ACRHWFTTYLLRSGMKESLVQVLRGDSPGRSMDIYHHIDWPAVRQEYLRRIPKLLTERQRRRAAAAREALAVAVIPVLKAGASPGAAVQGPAQNRGGTPSLDRLELRKLMAEDQAALRKRRPSHYSRWLQARTGRSPKAAMQMVLRELHWLRASMQSGPQPVLQPARRGESPPAPKVGLLAPGAGWAGPVASLETLELRRMLADDLTAGRLRTTGEYGRWLQEKSGRSLASARETVRQSLRALGVPAAPRMTPSKPLTLEARVSGNEAHPVQASAPKETRATRAEPASGPKPTTLALREFLATDVAAGALRQPADYLAWLQERTGTSRSAAGNIVRRELRALSPLPPATPRTAAPSKAAPEVAPPPSRDPNVARREKPGSGGRKPNPETVRLRQALESDAAMNIVRTKEEYLAILATGTPKLRNTALHLLNKEARRILGSPLKADRV
ncbi:MAG TPA: hypothetical protein VM327_08575, partial [Candidatus Thermoplasmatota archaeon]|nr:hypothetical protein [Candidatus Thermoplasmatota archaeon]